MPDLLLVLGDQLFAPERLPAKAPRQVFMAEDYGLCTVYRIHQQKIALFLAAMRAHAEALTTAGFQVQYRRLETAPREDYRTGLAKVIKKLQVRRLWHYAVADRSVAAQLTAWCDSWGVERVEIPSPAFLTNDQTFAQWLDQRKQARMLEFYPWQRKRFGILLTPDGGPRGGRWSFDGDNRLPVPEDLVAPVPALVQDNPHLSAVMELVRQYFPDHPGKAADLWVPTTRTGARAWLEQFCQQRLPRFGPYEDALCEDQDILFHSVLSPLLNLGLLTPKECVEAALATPGIPLNSLEGFVRQVIGWREFVKGIDAQWGAQQAASNSWGASRQLASCWFTAQTGIPPLDHVLRKIQRLAWSHHIERLMILGNMMQLCEIAPPVAFRFFQEMHLDSAEWVMGPNVYGMALGSDGGLMMTKPYICASPYLRKMGAWAKGPWCDEVDGLYWRFVAKHSDTLRKNPRTAQAVATLGRLRPERRTRLELAAQGVLDRLTRSGI